MPMEHFKPSSRSSGQVNATKTMSTTATPVTGPGQTETPTYETKSELARRLGVSTRTICNLMARGLPYIRLTGKLVRFPRVAVDGWMNSQQINRA